MLKDDIYNYIKSKKSRSIFKDELKKRFTKSKEGRGAYKEALTELIETGQVLDTPRALYLVGYKGLVRGEVVRSLSTYAFIKPDDGEEDIFVGGRNLNGAIEGDLVIVQTFSGRGGKTEGEVLAIYKESDRTLIGTVVRDRGRFMLRLDRGEELAIGRSSHERIKEGERVVARIEKRAASDLDNVVEIIASFGDASTARACAKAALIASGVPTAFSEECKHLAKHLQQRGIKESDLEGRLDLRGETIFTIDSADSKDLDDAISIEKTASGYFLGVHIADVAHYVRRDSVLDEEAFERGTSVYFADSVVPMLPKEISNGICSLHEGVDRLAFSALMNLDESGVLVSYEFKKSVIRSAVKGVYSEVNAVLDDSAAPKVRRKYLAVKDKLVLMRELAGKLEAARMARGSLDIETNETKIIVDENGRAVDVQLRTRGESERIIEEFMLKANEAAAKLAKHYKLPFVYRVHEDPPRDKVDMLKEKLDILGIQSSSLDGEVTPETLSALLRAHKGEPIYPLLNMLVVRSLAKARYDDKPEGHFGLVLEDYAHFTSPIRRYPDLAIHRILSSFARGRTPSKLKERYSEYAWESARRSTECEIRAMHAQYVCEDIYKAEYMSDKVGQEFTGVVVSCVSHGIYVELETGVEGLIRTATLPMGFEFDGSLQFHNAATGKTIRPGDECKIVVASAVIETGKIDFELAV